MAIKASVKKGFEVTKKSLTVIGILSVFGFVWSFINIYIAPKIQAQAAAPSVKISVLVLIGSLIFILASIFLQAGTLGYVRDKIKQGKSSLVAFTAAGFKYYLRLLAVGIIITLIAMLFILVAALAVAFLKKPGLVIAIPAGLAAIYAVLLMFFAPYIVVVNEEKPIASIKKSAGLVKKNFLRVLGLLGILIAIGFVIGLLAGAILGLLNIAIQGITAQVIYAVISSFLNALLGIFVTASFMNFYLEISNTNTAGA